MTTTRHDDGSLFWPCRDCATTVTRYRGQNDLQCPKCGAWYNGSGQRLRDDWADNPSNYDENISDLEGFEIAQLRKEQN
jgi:predicted ATP-dependent serine protease